ncbi:hypothetical protein ACQEU8_02455 [Streptomyces sp. CA-250714]|uniref:hypothetical protein n=1 Tax=Streptomyces sp. CA-250714 TaxID=3240060 RepID=UPI003D922A02
MALWTPFAAGQRITAGKLNQMVGEWLPYNVRWTADSGTTTLGNGLLSGKYQRVGNSINFRVVFEWGSGTFQSLPGQNWHFTLPVAAYSGEGTIFWPCNIWLLKSSTRFVGAAYVDPPTQTISAIVPNAANWYMDDDSWPTPTAENTTTIKPGKEIALSGARINLWGSYEAAE